MEVRRSRRLSGLVVASCASHVVLGLSATLVTGVRAWPSLSADHELALPAVALMFLALACFLVQGFAGVGLVRERNRLWWLITGAFVPVAVLGIILAADASGHALTSAGVAPPLLRAGRYADEVSRAIVIGISTSTVCCLLLSNAALIHAIASVSAVPRAARGLSARVALWSGVIALLFVAVVELVWAPMRWSSLPAGWVPAGSGFLAAMLVAQALSGHHVAEDTLRVSLPPGRSKEQRMRHLEFGRSVVARVARVQGELVVVLGAVVASSLFAGIVTELAAFRGVLLAVADEQLAASARVARIAASLEYLEVPLAVHSVHAVPALVVALSLVAMSPTRWGVAFRRGLPGFGLALGGTVASSVGMWMLVDAIPHQLGRESGALQDGDQATAIDGAKSLRRPAGKLVVVGPGDVSIDGRPMAASALDSPVACRRVAAELIRISPVNSPTFAVAAGVPFVSLRCLAAALAATDSQISWLVKPRINTTLPAPWFKLAQALAALPCALRRGAPRLPWLKLEASAWELATAPTTQPRLLKGPFSDRIGALKVLTSELQRLDIIADDELAADVVLSTIAVVGLSTKVTLIVGGESY